MKQPALLFWDRAITTIETAASLVDADPESAASRAYYAAFYAVSALFALEGKAFRKHQAVEAAVHRDLVNAGRWSNDLGKDYSFLVNVRYTSDYDVAHRVSSDEAQQAIRAARRILRIVRDTSPDFESDTG